MINKHKKEILAECKKKSPESKQILKEKVALSRSEIKKENLRVKLLKKQDKRKFRAWATLAS
jgi:hypothetical protein